MPGDSRHLTITRVACDIVAEDDARLALQAGDDCRHLEQAYGHGLPLDAPRMQPDRLTAQRADVGLDVQARLVRDPQRPETVPQAYLLARRRPSCSGA